MPTLEAIRLALRTIRVQKLKSFFSLIGVLIGVTFLIAVVSIVQGMNRYMVERFANTLVGANTFELRQRPSIVTGNVPDDVWLA
jgi:putative ABC transport system permease protein